MRFKTMFAVQVVALLTLGMLFGVARGETNGDTCTNLPDRPKVYQCWGCFQELLSSCDEENQTDERRQACYQAANTFFTWCLGRTTAPGTPRPKPEHDRSNYDLNKDRTFDVRTQPELAFNSVRGLTPDDILVRLRLEDGFEILDADNMWLFEDKGSYIVVLDRSVADLSYRSIGVDVQIMKNGILIDGFAVAVPVVDSFDLNHDGMFNEFDKVEAMTLFGAGELPMEQMLRIVGQ